MQVKNRRRWLEQCRTHRTSSKKGPGDGSRAEVFKNHLIVNSLLDTIIAKFVEDQPSINTSGRPPNQKYLSYFYRYSERLLKMFCRTKDPFFQEESEWRLVSKYYETYTDLEIKFREGRTTLVPFIEFHLSGMHDDNRLFEQVYVGPSPNFNLAYAAIASFLSNKKVCNITINSQSPLREL